MPRATRAAAKSSDWTRILTRTSHADGIAPRWAGYVWQSHKQVYQHEEALFSVFDQLVSAELTAPVEYHLAKKTPKTQVLLAKTRCFSIKWKFNQGLTTLWVCSLILIWSLCQWRLWTLSQSPPRRGVWINGSQPQDHTKPASCVSNELWCVCLFSAVCLSSC